MTKAMSEFTTDLQHSGMPAKDLDETIEFYTKKNVLKTVDGTKDMKEVFADIVAILG